MRYFILALTTFLIVSTGTVCAKSNKAGYASYYAHKFNGRKTASGETFNNKAFTCAHRKYPFNTILRVKRVSNGKVTYCRVNDRGPFVKKRVVDLSRRAAKDIGMISAGVAKVKINVHCRPGKGASKYNTKNGMVHCPEMP